METLWTGNGSINGQNNSNRMHTQPSRFYVQNLCQQSNIPHQSSNSSNSCKPNNHQINMVQQTFDANTSNQQRCNRLYQSSLESYNSNNTNNHISSPSHKQSQNEDKYAPKNAPQTLYSDHTHLIGDSQSQSKQKQNGNVVWGPFIMKKGTEFVFQDNDNGEAVYSQQIHDILDNEHSRFKDLKGKTIVVKSCRSGSCNQAEEEMSKLLKKHNRKSLYVHNFKEEYYIPPQPSTFTHVIFKHHGMTVMRFCEIVRSKGESISETVIFYMTLRMIDYLEFMRKCKWIHGDYKAQNVLINAFDDRIGKDKEEDEYFWYELLEDPSKIVLTVIDYAGSVRNFIFDDKTHELKTLKDGISCSMSYYGPELLQYGKLQIGYRSDIWSVGMLIWCIIDGKPWLWQHWQLNCMMYLQFKKGETEKMPKAPPVPTKFCDTHSAVSGELRDLIQICCDYNHEKRASLSKIKNHVFMRNNNHQNAIYKQPSIKSIKKRNRKRSFGEMNENGDGLNEFENEESKPPKKRQRTDNQKPFAKKITKKRLDKLLKEEYKHDQHRKNCSDIDLLDCIYIFHDRTGQEVYFFFVKEINGINIFWNQQENYRLRIKQVNDWNKILDKKLSEDEHKKKVKEYQKMVKKWKKRVMNRIKREMDKNGAEKSQQGRPYQMSHYERQAKDAWQRLVDHSRDQTICK